MAKNDELHAARQAFQRQAQTGALSGVYLLHGEEENLKQEAVSAARAAILTPGLEELNESRLTAPTDDELIAACETMPMMADRRLVICADHPGLTGRQKAETDALNDYLSHLPETCVLLFTVTGKANGTRSLYRAIAKAGQVVEFAPMGDAELSGWIQARFREAGKQCAPRTAELLIFTSGHDSAVLRGEIGKLCAYIGGRSGVTDDDVREAATRTIECTIFDLVDAAVGGQEEQAWQLMRTLQHAGADDLYILSMLLRQYRIIQHLKIMQHEQLSEGEMMAALNMRYSFMFRRTSEQAARCGGAEARDAVALLLQTEYQCKSGQRNITGSLETALVRLFALRHQRTRKPAP